MPTNGVKVNHTKKTNKKITPYIGIIKVSHIMMNKNLIK